MLEHPRYLIVEQEMMAVEPHSILERIGALIGVDDMAEIGRSFATGISHSSFGGHNRVITLEEEKAAADERRKAFIHEPDFVDAILDVCADFVRDLASRGILKDCYSMKRLSEGRQP